MIWSTVVSFVVCVEFSGEFLRQHYLRPISDRNSFLSTRLCSVGCKLEPNNPLSLVWTDGISDYHCLLHMVPTELEVATRFRSLNNTTYLCQLPISISSILQIEGSFNFAIPRLWRPEGSSACTRQNAPALLHWEAFSQKRRKLS